MSSNELRSDMAQAIEHLVARWAQADRKILRHLFPLLAQGRPVSVTRLVQASGVARESVVQALQQSRVGVDARGDVIEIYGVTHIQTGHRVETENQVLFTCCALVSQMLPRLLEHPMTITSDDPITGAAVRLVVGPEGLRSFEPESAVASMIVTDMCDLQKDAPLYFCNHVHHFASNASAAEFAQSDDKRYVVSIAELDTAAERLFSAVWS